MILCKMNSVILIGASRNASPREAQSKDPDDAHSTTTACHFPPRIPLAILRHGLFPVRDRLGSP